VPPESIIRTVDRATQFAGRVILTCVVGILATCAVLTFGMDLLLRIDESIHAWAGANWHWPAAMAVTFGAMIAVTFDYFLARSGD
jgi:hypothetical protein